MAIVAAMTDHRGLEPIQEIRIGLGFEVVIKASKPQHVRLSRVDQRSCKGLWAYHCGVRSAKKRAEGRPGKLGAITGGCKGRDEDEMLVGLCGHWHGGWVCRLVQQEDRNQGIVRYRKGHTSRRRE